MDSDTLRSILASLIRHALTSLGGVLVTQGVLQQNDINSFVGAGMVFVGILWAWWQKQGQAQVSSLLKGLTKTATLKDAKEVASEQIVVNTLNSAGEKT